MSGVEGSAIGPSLALSGQPAALLWRQLVTLIGLSLFQPRIRAGAEADNQRCKKLYRVCS
jgi:hypothetical protein